jgi:hypothetical protein
MSTSRKILCAIYGVIALAALYGTWSNNLRFFALPDSGGLIGFIRATLVNPASASIGVDILAVAIAASVFMVVEARRLRMRFAWLYVALSFGIAISVMFPLFLIARERALAAGEAKEV